MDLSKIEAGKLTVDIQPVDPIRILRSISNLHSPAAQAKGVGLRLIPAESALQQALADDNEPDTVRLLSHRMKGSAADFGACRLSEIAAQIEELAKRGKLAEATGLRHEADRAANRCRVEIERYQASLQA